MNLSSRAPIGMFDSGLGGLTVANALMRRLPAESLLYVGDTARVPYGPKSPDTVRRYAVQIGEWLRGQGVKGIVVACNTATAHALHSLQEALPVPVIGGVEPGARAAVRASRGGPIGVIGTSGTIGSGAYTKAIRQLAPNAIVLAKACPLFVPLVEEGWIDHDATRLIARDYLASMRADETAAEVERLLALHDLPVAYRADVDDRLAMPRHRFVASDAPDHFLALGRRFLDVSLTDVEYHVFA